MEEKKPEVKKTEEEKKEPTAGDEKKTEETKDADAAPPPPPPPPPPEIVLRVYMHCEGCARKVRKSLKGFQGVEEVVTDCKIHKVVVKGEKADPLKVLERVQMKSHRKVELLSPIPKPPEKEEEPKKPEEKEIVKPQEKKEELITVLLKVHMHCDACAQEIKRRILRMKGVENAEPDLKNSQVTVKGAFEAAQLVDYVSKRAGKKAVIVKVEPEKKEEEKPKEEKKTEGEAKKGDEGDGKEKTEGGGEGGDAAASAGEAAAAVAEDPKIEVKKNELYHYYPQNYQVYPQRYAHQEMYNPYPPQIFSDENPNACTVM